MSTPATIAPAANESVCVLSVGASDPDGAGLDRILHESGRGGYTAFECKLIARATLASAFSVLREAPVGIVFFDCDATAGTWGEMLDHISLLPDPPLLIVTSRLADERLWAEALNLGAWDVLAKPLESEEVMRIVSAAEQHWQARHGVHSDRTKQRKAATGT